MLRPFWQSDPWPPFAFSTCASILKQYLHLVFSSGHLCERQILQASVYFVSSPFYYCGDLTRFFCQNDITPRQIQHKMALMRRGMEGSGGAAVSTLSDTFLQFNNCTPTSCHSLSAAAVMCEQLTLRLLSSQKVSDSACSRVERVLALMCLHV